MFLPSNKSSKVLLSNTIKISSSAASLLKKTPNSTRILDKIASFQEAKKINVKSSKNPITKKSRNLYYEIKTAMTEKLTGKGSTLTSKRNSLNSLHSPALKNSVFDYSHSNGSMNRMSAANLASLPKSTRN
jgi:hypothetical protein